MKFFVLASNSFTGAHFVDYLIEKTDAEVVGISRSEEYPSVLLPYLYRKERSKRFTFHHLDVVQQLPEVLSLIEKFKPDYVVNYAAQGEVRNSWKWPEQWFETNTMAVVRLTNELAQKSYIKRYVAASTPEVYGATGANIVENSNYNPSTPYGVSKLSGDLFSLALTKRYNFPVCLTRAANLYGIHQQLYRIIPRAIIYIKQGKKIELHGKGMSVRSFIHAKDVADATFKVCLNGKNGGIYHLAPQDEGMTIAAVVRMIAEMMGKKFEDITTLIDENFGQDAMYSLSSTKIRNELGWKDLISFENGVQEMIGWIDGNWGEISQLPHDYIHKQ